MTIYFFDLSSGRQCVGSGAHAGSAGGDGITHTAALTARGLNILAATGALIGNHWQIC